jgi:hypothetical protein
MRPLDWMVLSFPSRTTPSSQPTSDSYQYLWSRILRRTRSEVGEGGGRARGPEGVDRNDIAALELTKP